MLSGRETRLEGEGNWSWVSSQGGIGNEINNRINSPISRARNFSRYSPVYSSGQSELKRAGHNARIAKVVVAEAR
jgi:hypothetical protein